MQRYYFENIVYFFHFLKSSRFGHTRFLSAATSPSAFLLEMLQVKIKYFFPLKNIIFNLFFHRGLMKITF